MRRALGSWAQGTLLIGTSERRRRVRGGQRDAQRSGMAPGLRWDGACEGQCGDGHGGRGGRLDLPRCASRTTGGLRDDQRTTAEARNLPGPCRNPILEGRRDDRSRGPHGAEACLRSEASVLSNGLPAAARRPGRVRVPMLRSHGPVPSAAVDDQPEFREALEVVGNELAAHPQAGGDRARPSVGRPLHGGPDARPEIAVLPVLPERVVQGRWGTRSQGEIPELATHPLRPDEARLGEDREVVPRRTEGQMEGPDDGTEVVPRQKPQVFHDTTAGRLLERPPIRKAAHAMRRPGKTRGASLDRHRKWTTGTPPLIRRSEVPVTYLNESHTRWPAGSPENRDIVGETRRGERLGDPGRGAEFLDPARSDRPESVNPLPRWTEAVPRGCTRWMATGGRVDAAPTLSYSVSHQVALP